MSNELKVRGHPGGTAGNIILKSDGEPAILAVRDALAKYHGGIVVQEGPAVGESQSHGRVEEAGKTVREFVRVLKEQIEGKTNVMLQCDDVIIQRMTRWAAMMVSRNMVEPATRGERTEHAEPQQPRSGRKSGTSRSASRRSARMRSSQSGMNFYRWDKAEVSVRP